MAERPDTIETVTGVVDPAATPALPAPRLGDFELIREIGRGGMGVVYEARQVSLDRRVALKVLPVALGLSPHGLQRFEREARAAAALHQTHIVPVYAIGEDLGFHYYAMELIDGSSLERILEAVSGAGSRDPTISLATSDPTSRRWFDTVARLVADVADALHHAHVHGIVHRDVKPSNLLLSKDGRLCLADFGLARVTEDARLTMTGALLGTPSYMSPEQVAPDRMPLDHRTDIYSLGAVLYEMLTLQRPFAGDTREKVLADILTTEPRPPRRINHRIPAELETICAKAMEKDPRRRYATAAEFAEDLRAHLHHRPIAARRAGLVRAFAKWTRRHSLAATVVAAAVAIAVLGAWSVHSLSASRRAAAIGALSEAQFLAAQGSSLEALRRVDDALADAPSLTEAQLLRARLLIDVHRPEQALADADRLLARNGSDWAAHLIKAVALRGRGGADEQAGASIVTHLEVVEARAPGTADACYLRALAETDHARAIALLDRALDLDPAHGDALASRIRHRIAVKSYAAAALDAERLKVARPRSTVGRRMLAVIRLDRFDYEAALAEIEAAIVREPQEAENWWTRAEILYGQGGDKQRVLGDYGKAIELRPNSAFFHARKARALASYGEHAAAVLECESALRLDPTHLEASEQLIGELRALGRIDRARQVVHELVDRTAAWSDPRDRARALRIAARAFVRLGEFAQALPLAEGALALDPAAYDGPLTRAEVRLNTGDSEGALADCIAATERPVAGPDELVDRIAGLLDRCGRADLALSDADRLVELAPEWPAAWRQAAVVNTFIGRTDQAIALARHAAELAPKSPAIHNSLGGMFINKYQWEEAIEEFTRAVELDPHQEDALGNRGAFPMRFLGRVEEGLADLDRAQALAPGDEIVGWARSILLAHAGRCAEADDVWQGIERRGRSGSTIFEDRTQVYAISFWPKCRDFVDLRRLIEDGRQAVARASAGRMGTAQLALGAALYRTGRFTEARTALREGLDRVLLRHNAVEDEQDENAGRFLLAMSAARLGLASEARAEFRRAMERTRATHRENDPDLVALRREAEAALGVR